MTPIESAKKYLDWNTQILVSSADLKKAEIGIYFADAFKVRANGRDYDADHNHYFDFLNQFRSTIHSIRYDCHDFISDSNSVAIPLTAHILRTNGDKENFEAILILKFNSQQKITLWQEVYVKL